MTVPFLLGFAILWVVLAVPAEFDEDGRYRIPIIITAGPAVGIAAMLAVSITVPLLVLLVRRSTLPGCDDPEAGHPDPHGGAPRRLQR